MTKTENALVACEKVLNGIEDNTITVTSALLLCLKIARLLNDTDAIMWLQYEYGGYPRNKNGYIQKEAWQIAWGKGRGYIEDGKELVFSEIASELEEKIAAQRSAVNNFTTQGASVSGEWYYDYALEKQIEISFGNVATTVFSEYRTRVENEFSKMSKENLLKLQAIEDKINSENPELYSQALTTCRRLFEGTAKELFEKYFPEYGEKKYKTKSGKEIDVSGEHYKNKLSAVIEKLEDKSPSKSMVGSNVIYLLDWIDNLTELQCKGVHHEVTRRDATRCIIQTYICLGDILSLQDE